MFAAPGGGDREKTIQIQEPPHPRRSGEADRASSKEKVSLSHSVSQPLSSIHRRAATVLDRRGERDGHHSRRSSFSLRGPKRPTTATEGMFPQHRRGVSAVQEEVGAMGVANEKDEDEGEGISGEEDDVKQVHL